MNNTFYPVNDYRDYLCHGGPGSGRYPKGSGKNPFQHVAGKIGSVKRQHQANNLKYDLPWNKSSTSPAPKATSPWFEQTVKGGKDKPPKSPAQVTAEQTGKIVQNTADVVNAVSQIKNGKKQSAAKSMTDAELREALNRLRMEAEFDRLTKEDTSTGMNTALAILGITGSLVGIAGGLATILSTLNDMKK